VRRFKKEAELSSRLSSRHTLAVKSFGLVPDGRPYMVLDFIDGMPAHEIIVPEKGVALKRALPIFVQIAEGLAHAHELGIIHRDIKPTNIMLQRLGGDYYFAKIVDFGIAKQWTSDSGGCTTLGRLTQPGHAVGSPMYMSPEQCIGSNLDHRTDIYSFGCLMYEMLTGRIIFAANNPVVMMNKHVNEQPAPMALPGSPVSEDIERVVFKALAKNRDDRYSEVKELKSNLQNIVARLGSSGNSDSGNAGQTRKESRYGNAFPSQGAT
jgi:serine/threonine-protein kinase